MGVLFMSEQNTNLQSTITKIATDQVLFMKYYQGRVWELEENRPYLNDQEAQTKRITIAFIYVDKPNCVTASKNFCITTVDNDGNPLWSEVTRMFYAPNKFLKMEFKAGKNSELAIDNLVLRDCSPDRSTLQNPSQWAWNKVKLIF